MHANGGFASHGHWSGRKSGQTLLHIDVRHVGHGIRQPLPHTSLFEHASRLRHMLRVSTDRKLGLDDTPLRFISRATVDGATPSPLAISGSGRQSLSCCSIAMRSPWVSCPFLLLGILSTSPRPNAAGTMVSDGIREANRFFPRLNAQNEHFR